MAAVDSGSALPIAHNEIRSAIIDQIAKYGIHHLTSRKLRENIGKEYGIDLTDHKAAIESILFDVLKNEVKTSSQRNDGETRSSSDSDSDSDDGSTRAISQQKISVNESMKKKKDKNTAKRTKSESSSDFENSLPKRRRAAAPARKPAKKRIAKSDNNNRVKPKRRSAYSAYCALSCELSDLLGKTYLKRSDVVKCMWAYFKANNLMDPKDKRYVLCDEKLLGIFKKRRFLGFGMMKSLESHVIASKFLSEEEREKLEAYERKELAKDEQQEDNSMDGSSVSAVENGDSCFAQRNTDASTLNENDDDESDENDD